MHTFGQNAVTNNEPASPNRFGEMAEKLAVRVHRPGHETAPMNAQEHRSSAHPFGTAHIARTPPASVSR
jgi:hypothetical protein